MVIPEDERGDDIRYLTVDRRLFPGPADSASGGFRAGMRPEEAVSKGIRTVPVRVEAWFTAGFDQEGQKKNPERHHAKHGGQTANLVKETLINAASNLGAGLLGLPITYQVARYNAVSDQIPTFTSMPSCACWGNERTSRFGMIQWAISLLKSRIDFSTPERTNHFTITEQLNGKYVELNFSQEWPLSAVALTRIINEAMDSATLRQREYGEPITPPESRLKDFGPPSGTA